MNSISLTKKKISADIGVENLVWLQDAAREKKISMSAALDMLVTLWRRSHRYELTDAQAARVKEIIDQNYRLRLGRQVARAEQRLEKLKAQQKAKH